MFGFLRTAGPTLSPFNAWVLLKGLETLTCACARSRRRRSSSRAGSRSTRAVERVYYPGPRVASAARAREAPAEGRRRDRLVRREGRAGTAAWRVIDSTQLISITANLGDVKTTITHPATTTHGRISPEARAAAGIREGLVRVAVGLEAVADLQADLERGLA